MNRYIALLKIVELGSFTKAAEFLGYTQPAISQMMTSLENELSIKLLSRSRYGIRLTPEGERLLPSIQSTVANYESMQSIVSEIKGLDDGIIRIGTVESISCHWLPDLIKGFWEKYPKVKLVLHQGDYTSIPEWVRTGEVDFGFINPAAVVGMETKHLKSGLFSAVLPADHHLAGKSCVSLPELADDPFLLIEEGSYSEPLEAFRSAGISPNVRLRVHDDYSILAMVEKGLGISIMTDLILRRNKYNVAVLPIEPPIYRDIGLVMKDKASLSIACRYFLSYLYEHLDELP